MDVSAPAGVDDADHLEERALPVEEYLAPRAAAERVRRSRAAVEQGLPNSLFGMVAVYDPTGRRSPWAGSSATTAPSSTSATWRSNPLIEVAGSARPR